MTGTIKIEKRDKDVIIENGKIDGKNIYFEDNMHEAGMSAKTKYKGVLSGDKIRLVMELEISGVRIKGLDLSKPLKHELLLIRVKK